jgi:hypothetical protein
MHINEPMEYGLCQLPLCAIRARIKVAVFVKL